MINCLFQFDTTTPGAYLIGGNLEPLTKAFFASMVKCYKLRYTSGLMSPVLARMLTAYVDAFGGFPATPMKCCSVGAAWSTRSSKRTTCI